ncbi:MAG: hypothetical protein ACT4TC_17680 [Myxococcaceae bacterium]
MRSLHLFSTCGVIAMFVAGCAGEGGSTTPARLFLTSKTYPGNFGQGTMSSLAKADSSCQELAGAAGLGGNFKAYLSNSATDAYDRLTFDGEYVSLEAGGATGTKIFNNKEGWRGPPLAVVARDEAGKELAMSGASDDYRFMGECPAGSDRAGDVPQQYSLQTSRSSFWLGANAVGSHSAATCSNWTTNSSNYCLNSASGESGTFEPTPEIGVHPSPCGLQLRFLCFEAKYKPR